MLAAAVLPRQAGRARAARLEHLDRHPVTGNHTPPLRGPLPDRLDDSDRLMTGDERESAREFSGVLLMIGPAQPAGLHPHQPVVVTDHGDVELPNDEAARRFQHQHARDGAVRHSRTVT